MRGVTWQRACFGYRWYRFKSCRIDEYSQIGKALDFDSINIGSSPITPNLLVQPGRTSDFRSDDVSSNLTESVLVFFQMRCFCLFYIILLYVTSN